MSNNTPGGKMERRPLHFIWILDCSRSMRDDGKIQILNQAIKDAIPFMQKSASDNPFVNVLVRAITFSDGAQWHISQPTPVENLKWNDITADGLTSMGKALSMVAEQLNTKNLGDERGFRPVLVLVSDGLPTDDFQKGLNDLMSEMWGQKAIRLAIAIGKDADLVVLQKFINHPEIKPLEAQNSADLTRYIKYTSTQAGIDYAAKPLTFLKGGSNIPQPPSPSSPDTSGEYDIWD